MGKYKPENLVNYFKTVELCRREQDYWIEMTNYADAFEPKASSDTVKTVVIATTDKVQSGAASARTQVGAYLDAVDVVRFQRAALNYHTKYKKEHHSDASRYIGDVLAHALRATDRFKNLPLKASADQVKCPASAQLDPSRYSRYSFLGFTPYFPKPCLILKEQRTKLKGFGKTMNCDLRNLKPIYVSKSAPVPKSSLYDFFQTMDEKTAQQALQKLNISADRTTLSKEEKRKLEEELKGKLHDQLEPIACFAFRGDTRPPDQVFKAGGLHSTMALDLDVGGKFYANKKLLHVDAEWKRFSIETAKDVAAELKKKGLDPKDPKVTLYLRLMMYLGNVDNYTQDQTYKPYVSTTTSLAIAKCFANLWADKEDTEAFTYAVRCRSALRLPSTLDSKKRGNLKAPFSVTPELKAIHSFANFAEQEILVPCGIFNEDIVGWRLIRTNSRGQFLGGPVFLQNRLLSENNAHFSALFELLSGRSQGEDPEYIFNSYESAKDETSWVTQTTA
jgi:hypothetical protein